MKTKKELRQFEIGFWVILIFGIILIIFASIIISNLKQENQRLREQIYNLIDENTYYQQQEFFRKYNITWEDIVGFFNTHNIRYYNSSKCVFSDNCVYVRSMYEKQ